MTADYLFELTRKPPRQCEPHLFKLLSCRRSALYMRERRGTAAKLHTDTAKLIEEEIDWTIISDLVSAH